MEEIYFIEIDDIRVGAVALNVNIKNKNNENFYVNKCGYKIVEFFNEYHKDNTYWEKKERMRVFELEYLKFERIL